MERKLKLTDNAVKVLERRYLKKDPSGRIVETPVEMFHRVARNIASAETLFDKNARTEPYEKKFLDMMTSLEFLPNSPALMNAGRRLQQLAACFVLPIDDSIDSIFAAVKKTAIIHQSGGGTGFSFNRIRPSGDMVGSTGGIASGPISFMRVFNSATEAIKQGGTRRGANMGVLRVDHPDIISFIKAKEDPGEFVNFNLSVALTSEFMSALARGSEYALINPRTGKGAGTKSAAKVFDAICEAAWQSGEPGVLFIDRINEFNPTPALGRIEATNPCGEQPLLPYEPCVLGSINLARMLKRSTHEPGRRSEIDHQKLARTAALATRFLDNAIEANLYPFGEIERMAKGNRKIGLGVMGFADMLVRLRIRYGSEESFKLAGVLMREITEAAREASKELATERGPFPNFVGSVFDTPGASPVRSATVTTVAPTGTLALIAGCNSSIEPYYALHYSRNVLGGETLVETNPLVEEVAREEGFYSRGLMDFISRGGTLAERPEVPEDINEIFITAFDVTPKEHIRMQAAFQAHTDNAVSKTINLSPDATIEDVKGAYMLAYELGCKGVTVFRSGSRPAQVLTCGNTLYC